MKRLLRTVVLIGMAIPLLLIGIIVIRAFLKPPLNSDNRSNGIGEYVTLSRGVVHYQYNKVSETGPTAVLIHGITVPMVVWEKTVPALNDAGISTIRMDLYGRGYSDRPRAKYGAELYINLVRELLDSLEVETPVHLVGVSMGAAVAAHTANRIPDRVQSVTLIDPAVMYRSEEDSQYARRRFFRGVNALTKLFDTSEREEKEHLNDFRPHIREQFSYRGIEFTLISMAIYGNSHEFINAYRELARQDIPTQIIWGETDHLLPVDLGKRLQTEFDSVPLHIIPGAGHTPHYEDPETVNPILVSYIKSRYNEEKLAKE